MENSITKVPLANPSSSSPAKSQLKLSHNKAEQKISSRASISLDSFHECYDNYQPWHHLQLASNIQAYYLREEEEAKMQPAVITSTKEIPEISAHTTSGGSGNLFISFTFISGSFSARKIFKSRCSLDCPGQLSGSNRQPG